MRAIMLLLAIVVSGCSTEGQVTRLIAGSATLPPSKSWSVVLNGCEPTACIDIRTAVVARLMGAGVVEGISSQSPVVLQIDIERTRSVSTAERVLFGAMAGRNEVEALVTLKDGSGTAIRSFRVKSGSAAHPLSFEAGVQDAYRQFGNDVVAGVRG